MFRARAAVYYVLNIGTNQRNQELMLKTQQQNLETRKIGVVQDIIRYASTSESVANYYELLKYDWKDYDDFDRKYGPDNNLEATAKREALWIVWGMCGSMVRKGIVEIADVSDAFVSIETVWLKFKPIIEEVRLKYYGAECLRDMEYLADEIYKYRQSRDASKISLDNLGQKTL